MQLSDRTLSRRYALALYLSAAERGEEEKVNSELARAHRALSDKLAAFKHPRVSVAEKKDMLKKTLGKTVSPLVERFLELLVEKKRFGLLAHLAPDFEAIHDERRGVVNAHVRSAAELSGKDAEALQTRLGKFSGKKENLHVTLAPELLAGSLVRMGDRVFDGSLKGRLQRMKSELTA